MAWNKEEMLRKYGAPWKNRPSTRCSEVNFAFD